MPVNDGGTFITGYEYSLDGGVTFQQDEAPNVGADSNDSQDKPYLIISRLTNAVTYPVVIRALNYAGAGAKSNTKAGRPVGVPPAPRIITAASTPNGALVTFSPPISNGGATITNYGYVVTTENAEDVWGEYSPVTTVSPLVIPGLLNGVRYAITIFAINSYGYGEHSSEASVIPGAPSAPHITTVIGRNEELLVNFTTPSSTGGAPITNYLYSLDSGATYNTTETTTSPISIRELINGESYRVRLRAQNSLSKSAPSNIVTAKPTNLPSAPTINSITTQEGAVLLYFSPPTITGGAAIQGYQYALDNINFVQTIGTTSPLSISGLNIGQTYSFYIRAFNIFGTGESSQAVTTTLGTPGAPSIDFITSTPTSVEIAYTPPYDGGSALLNHEYSLNSGAWVPLNPASTESPLILTSQLTANTRYSIRIRGINARGAGMPSNEAQVAKGLSTEPQISSIRPENGTLTLNILPPGNHVQPIVDYKYNVYTDIDNNNYIAFGATTFPITSLTIPIND